MKKTNRERMEFGPVPGDVIEDHVSVDVPRSTFELFNAVMGHPVTEASQRYLDQMDGSMTYCSDLFPLPDVYSDSGSPQGKLTEHRMDRSVFYPGTWRRYWLYEPAGTPEGPLSLIVMLDADFFIPDQETGETKESPELVRMFDNLIASKKIPPAIVLFAGYGEPGPGQPINGFSEGEVNRSLEYDTASDRHARFLAEELLPAALAGQNISADPGDHILCGFSSSGIAAFCAGWFRPDLFGKLFLGSPSFVNIRGGFVWPSVIRVNARKPLKIFQTAGIHDLDNIFGSWLCGNYDVASALHYADYDHLFYLTEAGHSLDVFYHTLPDGLVWLSGGPVPEFAHMERQLFREVLE